MKKMKSKVYSWILCGVHCGSWRGYRGQTGCEQSENDDVFHCERPQRNMKCLGRIFRVLHPLVRLTENNKKFQTLGVQWRFSYSFSFGSEKGRKKKRSSSSMKRAGKWWNNRMCDPKKPNRITYNISIGRIWCPPLVMAHSNCMDNLSEKWRIVFGITNKASNFIRLPLKSSQIKLNVNYHSLIAAAALERVNLK